MRTTIDTRLSTGKTISEIQWELKKADERLRGRTLTETKERKDAHHHECKFALGEQTPLAGRDGRVVGGFAIRRRKGQEEAASTANGTTPLVEYRACVLSDGGDAIPVEHV